VSARWVAAALLATGVALYAAVAMPMQRQAADAAEEYRRARDEGRDIRTRLARLERREAAHARAVTALPGADTPGGTVRAVRRSMVRTLQDARLSGVRLGVSAARAPFTARVRLTTEGPFSEVVALMDRVARPETGVVLEQVRLVPRSDRVALELEAVTLGRSQ
jgi:hypothetical protein